MFSDFLSHLEELRRRFLVALVAFFAASILSYFFSGALLDFLILPLKERQNLQLYFQAPHEAFIARLQVSAIFGLLTGSPVIFSQLWFFIAPGLYPKEKRILLPLIAISVLLFITGIFFAYFFIIPWGLHFLLSFQTSAIKPLLGIGPYFSFVTSMLLAFGILFDFPIILLGLIKLDMVRTRDLARARKGIVVSLFVAAAILTPSPDPLSQILLALPLIFLFEISLLIGRIFEKEVKVIRNSRA